MLILKSIAISLLLLFVSSCGYRPTSVLVDPVLLGSVSTHIEISMRDPDNTVLLKDALNKAVVEKFRASLTDRESASTHLLISLESTQFIPMRYDVNGYIISYRAIIGLRIVRTTSGETKVYRAEGTYQFNIEPTALISDQSRFEAIDRGSQKALDSFVAQISSEGALKRQ